MSMSGISYHELQGNAPKNSPAQRKQFLVVCTIGLSVFLHSIISAGIIEPVSIYDDGVYPGGEYVYKMLVRYVEDSFLVEKTADCSCVSSSLREVQREISFGSTNSDS